MARAWGMGMVVVLGVGLASGCAWRRGATEPEVELAATEHLEGIVAHANAERVVLLDRRGDPVALRLDGETRVLLDGELLGPSALLEGEPVRASYVVRDGVEVATELEIIPWDEEPRDRLNDPGYEEEEREGPW